MFVNYSKVKVIIKQFTAQFCSSKICLNKCVHISHVIICTQSNSRVFVKGKEEGGKFPFVRVNVAYFN